jgi:hypothetical protein
MTIEVRLGLLRHTLVVDGVRIPIRREGHGWYALEDPSRPAVSRIRHGPFSDRLQLVTPAGTVDIRFGWRRSEFSWNGRAYRVRSVLGRQVRVEDGPRVAMEGKTTWSGIRVDYVAPDLEPIAQELATGLAFRWMAFWSAAAAAAGA